MRIIFLVFLYTVALLLVKGGHNYDSVIGLPTCGMVGNVLVFVHLGISLWCAIKMGQNTIDKDKRKEELGYVFLH